MGLVFSVSGKTNSTQNASQVSPSRNGGLEVARHVPCQVRMFVGEGLDRRARVTPQLHRPTGVRGLTALEPTRRHSTEARKLLRTGHCTKRRKLVEFLSERQERIGMATATGKPGLSLTTWTSGCDPLTHRFLITGRSGHRSARRGQRRIVD